MNNEYKENLSTKLRKVVKAYYITLILSNLIFVVVENQSELNSAKTPSSCFNITKIKGPFKYISSQS